MKIRLTKPKVKNAPNLEDEIKKTTKKLQTFTSRYFLCKSYSKDDRTKVINLFNKVLGLVKRVMVVIEFYVGNLKGCWKKSLNLLIHQLIRKFDGSYLKQKIYPQAIKV